jgi:hypothetical protein
VDAGNSKLLVCFTPGVFICFVMFCFAAWDEPEGLGHALATPAPPLNHTTSQMHTVLGPKDAFGAVFSQCVPLGGLQGMGLLEVVSGLRKLTHKLLREILRKVQYLG